MNTKPPVIICPICEKRFTRASVVLVIDKKNIIHEDFKCWSIWFSEKQKDIPEPERERIGRYDAEFRFTQEYEKSDKAITEGEFNEFKKMFNQVYLLTAPIIVKTIVRGRIWEAVGRKYAQQLQLIHALNRIHEKKKDTWRSNFKKTFVPSVLTQFKSRGYLSKKQWDLVDDLVRQEMDDSDREYFYRTQNDAREIENLVLPDRLRYMQRKKSFIKWFNEKNGLTE